MVAASAMAGTHARFGHCASLWSVSQSADAPESAVALRIAEPVGARALRAVV